MKTIEVPEQGDKFTGSDGELMIVVEVGVSYQLVHKMIQKKYQDNLDSFLKASVFVPSPKRGETWKNFESDWIVKVSCVTPEGDVAFRSVEDSGPGICPGARFLDCFERVSL